MINFKEENTIEKKVKLTTLSCKLIDFNLISGNEFIIQMFGIDEKRKTYSITIKNFKPFFYIKIPSNWS